MSGGGAGEPAYERRALNPDGPPQRPGKLWAMATLFVQDLRRIARGLSDDPTSWPYIPCPSCKRAGLTLLPDSLVLEEANQSKSWHALDYWDPDFIYGGFHCVLQCYKDTCDIVRVVGRTGVYEKSMEEGYHLDLRPLFFMPELPLIQSFGDCPKQVRERIEAASPILWVDPSAAANRLRSAVEALMDHEGIPRRWSANGKTYDISLHNRIERFKTVRSEHSKVANLLLAVKWIGNVGSHGSAIRVHDVLDAIEILDRTIQQVYDTSTALIEEKAEQIIARKGLPTSHFADLPLPPF